MAMRGRDLDASEAGVPNPFEPSPRRSRVRVPNLSWEDGPFIAEGIATELDELDDASRHETYDTEDEWEDENEEEWTSLESEGNTPIPAAIAMFATGLAATRAQRTKRAASVEEAALLQDYRDTLEGARGRWGQKYGKGRFTTDAIGRAWMISRKEETAFAASAALFPKLQIAPPREPVALIPHPLVGSSTKAPVAPIVGRFAEELNRRYAGMRAENYRGHGGGAFDGRGHSLDLYIKGRDNRGFYPVADAVKFLTAVHEAAGAVNAQWRVIYNDSSVADAINRATGKRHVIFVGTVRRNKGKRVTGLNWHGPDPMILHFHLDLAPRAATDRVVLPPITPSVSAPASTPLLKKPEGERVRFAQRVLNAVEGERLGVDGDLGPKTRAALARFRTRHGLGADGVLDAKTELALVQRGIEELAQQSIFAQPGVLDASAERAIRDFKSQRGLDATATIDAATRSALADALERRGAPAASTSSTSSVVTNWVHVPRDERMAYVVKRLVDHYGYPPAGAAGIVGNLAAESGVLPNRIQGSHESTPMRADNSSGVTTDFTAEQVMNRKQGVRGPRLAGIGLAQWTAPDRRAGLFTHRFEGREVGAAILENMDAQIDYLVSELGSRRIDTLLRDPATSVEAASDEVVYNFEIPASVLTNGHAPKRPRSHASVQHVFGERRKSSRAALRAYRDANPERESPAEEADLDEAPWEANEWDAERSEFEEELEDFESGDFESSEFEDEALEASEEVDVEAEVDTEGVAFEDAGEFEDPETALEQESLLDVLRGLLSPGAVMQRVQQLLGAGAFGMSLMSRFASGKIWNEDHLALEILFHRQPGLKPADLDSLTGSARLKRLNALAGKHAQALTSIREGVVRPIFGSPSNFQIGSGASCQIQDLRQDVKRLGPLEGGTLNGKVWYKRSAARSPRRSAAIDSIVLHHMAFNRGNDLQSYLKVGAHYAVLADGQVGQLYDDLDFLNASNGFNSRSIAIEFAGNFPTIDFRWWKSRDTSRYDRCYVTPAQACAGRCLLSTLTSRFPGIRYVYAHRQSTEKPGDPGPDVWLSVGEWAIASLGLTDRLPHTHIGKGSPIPNDWRVGR